jgi:phage recombination protein Bet
MSTALVVPQSAQLAGWESKVDLITRTVAKGATKDELEIFLHQCRKTGLDPLAKQIYFQKRKNWKTGEETITIITGIDGYRLIADRTGKYAGNDDPEYDDPEKQPTWAKVTVYKMVEGQRCAFTATARWTQYFPGDKLGFMWTKMPHLMLGKCAEALALRKAFPAELSGVYTAEEMHQADERTPVIEAHDEPPIPAKRVITGTVTDIAETDKGHFYKLHDGEEEHIATTINKDFIKKLAGAHGLYVELAVHSQDLGKAKLIVDVLHIKEPEDLVPALKASIAQVEERKAGGFDDEKGLAYGTVKGLRLPTGKGPMKVDVQCGSEILSFATFSKTSQERLSECAAEGVNIELAYKMGQPFKGKSQRDIVEVITCGRRSFREETDKAMGLEEAF